VTLPPPELTYIVRVHEIGGIARREAIAASPAECAALAARFDLLALDRLAADLAVVRDAGGIHVTGRLTAAGAQACVVSAEPVPFALDEAVDLRFTDAALPDADEVELAGTDLDVLPIEGDALDLGEAVAQSLGLALDPYPRAPDDARAAAARFVITEAEAEAIAAADKARANPFAALRRPT
jgi:uncharacterized metal-binding protein YceD (DUF177 family)